MTSRLLVSDIALCEVVWVLELSYKVPRVEILAVLRRLLQARHLAFADGALLARAMSGFATGKGDVADYVIREHAARAGCTAVATFDRALLREVGFVRP